MKNKLKIYFFWIVILLFSNSFSSADEFTFNASEIIALNNENKIKAINGVEILTKDGVKITGDQFEYYKYSHITIDVCEGRGASFSLEIPLGLRFMAVSRILTDDEYKSLRPPEYK